MLKSIIQNHFAAFLSVDVAIYRWVLVPHYVSDGKGCTLRLSTRAFFVTDESIDE